MKLYQIADITSGLVVSRKKALCKSDIIKSYRQLNLRSINKSGYINENELEELNATEKVDSSYLTHFGDIVVRLTDPFTAVFIDERYKNLIITSNFCVIRNLNNYDSRFLAEYLNGDAVKKEYVANMQGSVVKNIKMSSISEIEIPCVDIKEQQKVGMLLVAETKKIECLEKLILLEEKRIKTIIGNYDERGEKNDR